MEITIPGFTLNRIPLYIGRHHVIFCGERIADKANIVVKFLKDKHPTTDGIAQFKHEYETAKMLAAVQEVVPVYSLEKYENNYGIVMENINLPTLAEVLQREKKLQLTTFLQLAINITEALGQIHQRNIIHKDINPTNILCDYARQQIKIIDFGIAASLPKEKIENINPTNLEGSLLYLSPEQTGRMNRGIDYRTDYYSLGVTFYQMLTGRLPYQADDPMRLIHCHIAVKPKAPHEIDHDIPAMISAIIIKLMAKNAEDRYQNTNGILADLKECQKQLHDTGKISPFELGMHDVLNRFQIPEKLYGRTQEVKKLLDTFATMMKTGEKKLMLVSGPSGIGKSTLVHEIHKPIVKRYGYFITGQFDIFKHNMPYSAISEAFKEFIKQILTEPEERITFYREKILESVGANGRVLIDIIPNLTSIIGEQPEVADYGTTENQNRLSYVFQNFIKAIAIVDHPLVIFLDDLQWADSSSLNLLESLLTSYDCKYLFLIGAYRSNNILNANTMSFLLERLNKNAHQYEILDLGPLTQNDVSELISDTLKRSSVELRPLVEICYEKTRGNPFFLVQLMLTLYKEQLIYFDAHKNHWVWQHDAIKNTAITDNVIELMIDKLQELKPDTQAVLKYAACIGTQFNLDVLTHIYETTQEVVLDHLQEALKEIYVNPIGNLFQAVTYQFAHERIQQAAYTLLDEKEKAIIHAKIARFLQRHVAADTFIFDIANHYNEAIKLNQPDLINASEKMYVAEVNMLAAKSAKSAAAFWPALTYIEACLTSLPSNGWEQNYRFMLEAYTLATEIAYLTAKYALMDTYADRALQQCKNVIDKCQIIQIRLAAKVAQNQQTEAIDIAREVLFELGISLPQKPNLFHVLQSIFYIKLLLIGKKIPQLSRLPEIQLPEKKVAIKLLSAIYGAAYLANTILFPLLICNSVILSLRYGNATESALAYTGYGVISIGVLGEIDKGYQFGELALDMVENKYQAQSVNVMMSVNGLIKHWKDPVKIVQAEFLKIFEQGLDSGNFEFGAYSILDYLYVSYFSGMPLDRLLTMVKSYQIRLHNIGQKTVHGYIAIYQQSMLNLIDENTKKGELIGDAFDERQAMPAYLSASDKAGLYFIYLNKLMLYFLFDEYAEAAAQIPFCDVYDNPLGGDFTIPVYQFYKGLTLLAIFHTVDSRRKRQIKKAVLAIRRKLMKWAKHAPGNIRQKYFLLEAELAWRIYQQNQKAAKWYDLAIKAAQDNDFLREEALSNELASKFYLNQGNKKIARAYMEDACYCYQLWGAMAKVAQLNKVYFHVLRKGLTLSIENESIGTTVHENSLHLDMKTILKATRTISSTIVLKKLLKRLMQIVIENAGAQKSFLLLKKNGHFYIEAESDIEHKYNHILQSIPLSSEYLPLSIINYVIHSKEPVILNNASAAQQFMKDAYIKNNETKSILCMPLLNKGVLSGILYMENNLTDAVFTKERLNIIQVLSSQIAISIDNASLYSNTEELNKQLIILNKSYERFVPNDFISLLKKKSITEVKLGDQVQETMTVLFTDIRNFTTRSEKMSPRENFNFINSILVMMAPIIRKYNGFVDKYIGDAIMALFPNGPDDALQCALTMQNALKEYNHTHQDYEPVEIGIGINTGSLMLGTVGEENRMNVTVISDTVNIASRAESLTKTYHCPILITEETHKNLKNPFRYVARKIGKLQVKGKKNEIMVYELVSFRTVGKDE